MNDMPRHPAARLSEHDIPSTPGVYAWYHVAAPIYSGRGVGRHGLRTRIWSDHLKTGSDLSLSPFRRYVCDYLGIAPTSKTKARPTQMTAAEIEPVNEWILGCEIAWIECASPADAETLEKLLHAEWMPALSRR
jgi:hypothetical protein